MSRPTLDDYFTRATRLAETVRRALDARGTVTRGDVRRELERFEAIDRETWREDACGNSAGTTTPSAGSTSS